MPDIGRPAENPWVLIRSGKPVVRFPSRGGAQQFFNQLRWNSASPITDAALFGPDHEAWYCQGTRHAIWERDDDRRKREAPQDADSGEAAA